MDESPPPSSILYTNLRDPKDRPFFSIIIPAYNTERYIAKCLESCINQTFGNIEIIIIDDCGQDQTMQIIKKYAQEDGRIQIIQNTNNLGSFSSRVLGILKAKGDYLLFVDSDDWIDKQTCATLSVQLVSQTDILAFDFQDLTFSNMPAFNSCDMYEMFTKTAWNLANKCVSKNVAKEAALFSHTNFKNFKCSMAEDGFFYFLICLFAKSYTFIPIPLYFYTNNINSTTKTQDLERKLQNIHDYNKLLQILKSFDFKYIENRQTEYMQTLLYFYDNLVIHQKYSNYTYFYCCAYQKEGFLSYPISFLKSFRFAHSISIKLKIVLRIFTFCITFGQIKL